jgi:hypothetical protein
LADPLEHGAGRGGKALWIEGGFDPAQSQRDAVRLSSSGFVEVVPRRVRLQIAVGTARAPGRGCLFEKELAIFHGASS